MQPGSRRARASGKMSRHCQMHKRAGAETVAKKWERGKRAKTEKDVFGKTVKESK